MEFLKFYEQYTALYNRFIKKLMFICYETMAYEETDTIKLTPKTVIKVKDDMSVWCNGCKNFDKRYFRTKQIWREGIVNNDFLEVFEYWVMKVEPVFLEQLLDLTIKYKDNLPFSFFNLITWHFSYGYIEEEWKMGEVIFEKSNGLITTERGVFSKTECYSLPAILSNLENYEKIRNL